MSRRNILALIQLTSPSYSFVLVPHFPFSCVLLNFTSFPPGHSPITLEFPLYPGRTYLFGCLFFSHFSCQIDALPTTLFSSSSSKHYIISSWLLFSFCRFRYYSRLLNHLFISSVSGLDFVRLLCYSPLSFLPSNY